MKVYDAIAMPFGNWGPWVVLDAVLNGTDQTSRLSIKAWQVDKLKAPFDGQLHWFGENDSQAHLTTFVGGFIDVDLASNSAQEPRVRFTNHSVQVILIRFTVGALLVLPSYEGNSPGRLLRDQVISVDAKPLNTEAWMIARSRSVRT